jgi:cysteine desulfurase/selenocysteine lyase
MTAQAVGLGAACEYLSELGMNRVQEHEHTLTEYGLERLAEIPGVRIVGPESTDNRGGTLAFVVDGIHSHDLGQVLDELGIAVRVGHHCAWPLHRRFHVQATTRASLYIYNTLGDLDALADGVRQAQKFFKTV